MNFRGPPACRPVPSLPSTPAPRRCKALQLALRREACRSPCLQPPDRSPLLLQGVPDSKVHSSTRGTAVVARLPPWGRHTAGSTAPCTLTLSGARRRARRGAARQPQSCGGGRGSSPAPPQRTGPHAAKSHFTELVPLVQGHSPFQHRPSLM